MGRVMKINQQRPSDMIEAIQNPNDGSQAPSGCVDPLVRPSAVGWWWCYHSGIWRCGKVREDWDDDESTGGLIWSDGGAWYAVSRINVDLLAGSNWFHASPPDWPNDKDQATRGA